MKFNCGKTPEEKTKAKQEWHQYFVWFPVRIGSHDCRWLETVQRKGFLITGFDGQRFWFWEYRSNEGVSA